MFCLSAVNLELLQQGISLMLNDGDEKTEDMGEREGTPSFTKSISGI